MLPVIDDTDQILSNHRERTGSKKYDAKQFLRQHLEGKPAMESELLFHTAEQVGISKNRLYEAQRELPIRTRPAGFRKGWVWSWDDGSFEQSSGKELFRKTEV